MYGKIKKSLVLYTILVANITAMDNKTIYTGFNTTNDLVEYVLLDERHPCLRPCTKDSPPMTCRYQFNVEWYHTLSHACYDCPYKPQDCYRPDCIPGDGSRRPALVVNRKLPGTPIEVCLGDEIIVDVINQMSSEGTTIHWHGQHQRNFPYMDGVPFVTQCPISPGSTFRYQFRPDNVGTHFWHSHIGMQRGDGAFGAMIVRAPKEDDPHAALYDYDLSEHSVMIIDWGEVIGLQKFLCHHHAEGDNKPATILINGYGRFKNFSRNNMTFITPSARFHVDHGFRYRFRLINAGFLNCPIELTIDNHTMTVINSDGNDFKPVSVKSLISYAGERFDFILNANQSDGLYWMRFRGLMDCDERFRKAFQVAVLAYNGINSTIEEYPEGEPVYDEVPEPGAAINSLNVGTEKKNASLISMPDLESLAPYDSSLKLIPDYRFYISFDFYRLNNPHFNKYPFYGINNFSDPNDQLLTPQLNHISMKMPNFAMLPQRHQIDGSQLCNETSLAAKNCTGINAYCECMHVLQVELNSIVEMVLIDEGFAFDANHPLHLHGHAFRVVALEKLGKNVTKEHVQRLDQQGKIRRNLVNPPVKDTVTVPDGGYTIIRFNASNPGYWLFHCHIEFHVDIGMGLVVKVGEDSQMLPVPKNFPKCGDYVPDEVDCSQRSFLSKVEGYLFGEVCDDKNKKNAGYNESPSIWTLLIMSIFTLIPVLK